MPGPATVSLGPGGCGLGQTSAPHTRLSGALASNRAGFHVVSTLAAHQLQSASAHGFKSRRVEEGENSALPGLCPVQPAQHMKVCIYPGPPRGLQRDLLTFSPESCLRDVTGQDMGTQTHQLKTQ